MGHSTFVHISYQPTTKVATSLQLVDHCHLVNVITSEVLEEEIDDVASALPGNSILWTPAH